MAMAGEEPRPGIPGEADPGRSFAEELRRSETVAPKEDFAAALKFQDKVASGGITEEQFNAEFVGQEKLGPPGAAGGATGSLRAFLSIFGDTFEEQQAAFNIMRPEGELVRVPTTGAILFRDKPSEQFRKLDAGFFESLGLGLTDFALEISGDIDDMAGIVPVLVGEGAATLLFRRPSGGSKVFSDLIRLGIGSAFGETTRQISQQLMGTQRQSKKEQAGLIAGESALSMIGGTLGMAGGEVINMVRGRGLLNLGPEAMAGLKAGERLETMPLLPSQASNAPLVRVLSRQSQALLPKIADYLTKQERLTNRALRRGVDKKARRKFIGETARAFERANKDILDLVKAETATARKSITTRRAGRGLQNLVSQWWKRSGEDVGDLYTMARAVEEPVFDVSRGFGGKPSLKEIAEGLKEGKLVRRTTEEGAEQQFFRADQLHPDVRRLVDDIISMEAQVERTNVGAFDQLQALRQRVDDFTLSGPEGPRINQALASDLKSAIVRTIENPVNSTPEFVSRWKIANSAAAQRFATREQAAVIDLMRTERPSQFARDLFQPGKMDDLAAIRQIVTPEEWRLFEDFATLELTREGPNLLNKLDEFAPEELNLIMSKPRQQVMRDVGEAFSKLDSTGIAKALENQTEIGAFLREIIDTNSTAGISEFKALVARQGGIDGSLGKSTQAALVNEVWRRSTVREQGVFRVDFNKITATLNEFREKGLLGLLDKDTVRLLTDTQIMQDFARMGVADAGTSIQAAEAAANLRGVFFGEFGSGLATIVENFTIGRLMTNGTIMKALLGKGRRAMDTRMLQLIAAATTSIATDMEGTQELGKDVLELTERFRTRLRRMGEGVGDFVFPEGGA